MLQKYNTDVVAAEMQRGESYFAKNSDGQFIGWRLEGRGVFGELAFFEKASIGGETSFVPVGNGCTEEECEKIFSQHCHFWWELQRGGEVALLRCKKSTTPWSGGTQSAPIVGV